MKKINFGYSNHNGPGPADGIGINPNLLLLDAEYYGAFKYGEDSYIVAKVTKDEYNHYPQLLGKFIVRPAVADLYPDGSGNIFLDQEETMESRGFENYFNRDGIKDKITSINDILQNTNGIYRADRSFKILTLDDEFNTLSITHDAFTSKNNAIKSCHKSFSALQNEIQQYYLEQENRYSGYGR